MDRPRQQFGVGRELGLLLLLGLLIFGGIGAVQVWTTRHAASDEAQRSVQTLANLLEDQASRTFTLAEATVRGAAEALAAAGDVPPSARLRDLVGASPVLRSLTLLDADGRVLVGGEAEVAGTAFADSALLARALETRLAVVGRMSPGRRIADPSGGPPGVWHIPVVVAVPDGRPFRYMVGTFNPQVLGELYAMIGATSRYMILVQAADGTVVSGNERLRALVGGRLPPPPIGRWDEARGLFAPTIGDRVWLAAFATVRQWPFVITVGIVRDDLLAASLDHLTPLALLLIVSLAIIFAVWTRLTWEVGARRRSEQDAILARQRLEDAIESIPDGFVLFDRDDRVVICNHRYREIFDKIAPHIMPGVAFEQLVRIGVAKGQYILPQDDDESAFLDAVKAARRGEGPAVERQLANGRWIRAIERTTSEGGAVGIRTDVTDLKQVATDLEAARDEAERASRAKSEFLAAMSHEIRTPLNGVLSTADLLALSPLSDQDRLSIDLIRRSGRTLLTILDEILDYSQLESGQVRIEARPCRPTEIARDVATLFAAACRQKGITMDVRVPNDFAVRTDPDRLRQILSNLIANAVKFTQVGGVVLTVEATAAGPGRTRVAVHVEDTGIGIDESDIPRLFERFTQAEGGNARRYGGTGLGLAISRSLARLLGGDITVRSRPGEGSRFSLRLDVLSADPPETSAEPASAFPVRRIDRPLSGIRVLVAEDNEVNRIVIGQILTALGADPVIVDDGFAAVERVQAEPFDVVLMDVQMPGLSGPDATRQIRALGSDVARVPIIALTANVLASDRETYIAAGMSDHLTKPVDLARLSRVILDVAADPARRMTAI
jgi:signal transduction histidine kinase/ActR/RegA family two-component response regulator